MAVGFVKILKWLAYVFVYSRCMQRYKCLLEEIDPKNAIASAQYNFMYDDAESDWGRDNIINKQWNCVSIDIVYDR